MLLNWALDGLEEVTKLTTKGSFINPNKTKFQNSSSELDLYTKHVQYSISNVWCVRYIDHFIIGIKSNSEIIQKLLQTIKRFLQKRGLELFEKKTVIKKRFLKVKIEFLGWKIYQMISNEMTPRTQTPRELTERKDQKKIY